MKKLFIIVIILIIFSSVSAEENKVKVKFFFTEECEHCKIAETYFEDLKKEYGEALEIEMIDVFTTEGYKEFKNYGFIMTPGIVFNEQVQIEGDTTKEELRRVIESFLTPKKVIVRFFYDKDKKDEEYEKINSILSEMNNKDVGVLYLDYDKNRNDFLYFGFSRVPSVSINEISFENNIDKELIDSVINFYLEEKDIKILGFYSDEKEKEIVENITNSERYIDKTSILWIDVNKNNKEFYLDGFSETPSVVINDKIKIQNVTKIEMIKGLESFDPKFYNPIEVYFIAYSYLKYIGIGVIGIVCIALYRVFL
ncbi:MAG: thioredoxin family protein [Methanomicrobia archaeon]|nr:thioredoxin family protein [Methanomicrobia archaeon]